MGVDKVVRTPTSFHPYLFIIFGGFKKEFGCTWTARRPNDTFASLCCHQLEHLLGSAASRPHIASHLFVFFSRPTPHPVSCITLLQSLFFGHDGTLAPISWDRVTAGRSLFGLRLLLIGGERKTEFPACEEKIIPRRKIKKFLLFIFEGIFLFFQFFPISYRA